MRVLTGITTIDKVLFIDTELQSKNDKNDFDCTAGERSGIGAKYKRK